MPIQFYDHPHRPEQRLRFLRYPPELYVMLLGPPEAHVKLYLHMREGRSVPCRGSECVDCPFPAFPYGYAAAMLGRWINSKFWPSWPAILPVTSESLDLLIDPHDNHVIRVWREPANKNGATRYAIMKEVGPLKIQPFDVLSRLQAMWRVLDAKEERKLTHPHAKAGIRLLDTAATEDGELSA